MIRSWQITAKEGETRHDEGRWLAQRVVAGYIIETTQYSYPTQQGAENAVALDKTAPRKEQKKNV